MFIKKILIKNYRAIRNETNLELVYPVGSDSGLNILIGRSNSGKTTAIEAIRLLSLENQRVNIDDSDKNVEDEDLSIEGEMSGGIRREIKLDDRAVSVRPTGPFIEAGKIRFVDAGVRRYWSSGNTLTPSGAAVPFFEQNVLNQSVNKSQIDQFFSQRFYTQYASHKDEYDAFFQKVFHLDIKFKYKRNSGQNSMAHHLEASVQSSKFHPFENLGDGLVKLVRIAEALINPEVEIVVIDEPEVGLDPDSQIRLGDEIFLKSFNKQIVVVTHSENLFEWEWFEKKIKLYKFFKDSDVSVLSPKVDTLNSIRSLLLDRKKPFLLDAETKKLVFKAGVLIMEGQEDVGILRNYCKFKNSNFKKIRLPFLGYGVGGKMNIITFLKLCDELKISAYAVYDAEAKTDMDIAKVLFVGNTSIKINSISTNDIRDKQNIAGLANEKGEIKAECEAEVDDLVKDVVSFFGL